MVNNVENVFIFLYILNNLQTTRLPEFTLSKGGKSTLYNRHRRRHSYTGASCWHAHKTGDNIKIKQVLLTGDFVIQHIYILAIAFFNLIEVLTSVHSRKYIIQQRKKQCFIQNVRYKAFIFYIVIYYKHTSNSLYIQ